MCLILSCVSLVSINLINVPNSNLNKSSYDKVTRMFELHKSAAIPLPIVLEPLTTIFSISIRLKSCIIAYNKKIKISR